MPGKQATTRSRETPLAALVRRCRRWLAAGLLMAAPVLAAAPVDAPQETPLAHYSVTRWALEQGLPHNQVHDIRQGANGFLWVATWEGVARFDGRGFRPLGNGWERAARRLLRDGDDMLVGGIQTGVWRFSVRGVGADACPAYPRLDVWALVKAVDGGIWIAASDGLFRLERDGRCLPVTGAEGLRHLPLVDVLADPDGSLWLASRQGLYRFAHGRLALAGNALGLPMGSVRSLLRDRAGTLWIAGEGGLWHVQDGQLQKLREERSEAVLQDRDGAIWVATASDGLQRLQHGRWDRLDAAQGLIGRATGALFEDNEGLLWMGTTHGLFRISNDPAWAIGVRQGLASDYVRSVLQDGQGRIWIGQADGLSRWRDGRAETVYPRPGEAGSTVLSLARAGDGGLWVGTYDRGVLRIAATQALALDNPIPVASLQGASVRALLEDADGSLWVGSERGLYRWREGVLARVPGLPELPVRAFQRLPDGGLWVGFQGGLAEIRADGRPRLLVPERDFPATSVFDFLRDRDGTLWMASDAGVLRLRNGRFTGYGRQRGVPANTLFRVIDDGFGNLWFTCFRGVFRVPRTAFAQVDAGRRDVLDLELFGQDDGMPSRQANGGSAPAGWHMADGRLWVPTAAGVAVFDPARSRREHARKVPLVIDQVQVDGKSQSLVASRFQVPAGTRVTISFAGASMRQSHNLRYRYRMQGFDRDWIEAGATSEASYTNLPPGDLRFEVQVARAPVDWAAPSDMAWVQFVVEAPWWRHPAWLALAALLLLAVPAAFYAWRGRQQRRRQGELEALVAQRTEELSDKNRQLEVAGWRLAFQATHDELTGLPNRREGDRFLAAAVTQAQAQATPQPLAVALLDIDQFKQVNDRHGHAAGDAVLQVFGDMLAEFVAEWGVFAARFGGEEFLLCMAEMDAPMAARRLQELLARVRSRAVLLDDGGSLHCTFSAGVAAWQPGQSPHALLAVADARLMQAKQDGRNRVVGD